jgi:uncharacterized protein (TIGR02466 family)
LITYTLFPTAVAKFELGRAYSAEEMAFVDSQPTHNNMGNTTSDDRYVLRHDTMASLKEFVENSVAEYLKSIYAPKHEVSMRLTQSWLNYTKPGQFHHKHAHPNSFISGVLYMKAARERDKIYFYKDGYKQISLPTDNWNLYNSESWWFEVGTGDLMLFPSSLTHMVETVKDDDRISLSFNTFPVGYVGEEESLTALHLEGAESKN